MLHEDSSGVQYDFYKRLDPLQSPRNVRRCVEYSWEDGWHPLTLDASLMSSIQLMWTHGPDYLSYDADSYVKYVQSKTDDKRVLNALELIVDSRLTQVKNCHGDLTFENIVCTRREYVFIDPGDARGCPCVEIDMGKLLQSMNHWETARRKGWARYDHDLRRFQPIHWAFCATHVARLLKHHNTPVILEWADEVLDRCEANL